MAISTDTQDTATGRTIVVDLDGTLVRTDFVAEGAIALLARRPWALPMLLIWLLRGRAFLKRRLAEDAQVSVELLPYDDDVLEYLTTAKARGHRLVLATAANSINAERVAAHLNLFDEVIASTAEVNAKGLAKLALVRERLGARTFVYIGDSTADVPMFAAAESCVLVRPSRRTIRAVPASKVERIIASRPRALWAAVRAMRPHQWTKNALVLLPAITSSGLYDLRRIPVLLVTTVSLSLLASSTYILNDLVDLPADRAHATKRRRPLASGVLPLHWGVLTGLLCLAAGVAVSVPLPRQLQHGLAVYLVSTILYSFLLKRLVLLDSFVLVGFYVLRVLLGTWAIEVRASEWFLTFIFLAFLCLALLKRFIEVHSGQEKSAAKRGYRLSDGDVLLAFGVGSVFASALVLALFTTSADVARTYSRPQVLFMLCPIYLGYAMYLWLLASRREVHHDPVLHVLRDPVGLLIGGLGLVVVFLAR